MRLVTWNVNSVRSRLTRVSAWLARRRPDVVCLQETKVVDADFPRAPFEALGYRVETHGEKTYNGVAILSRADATEVSIGIADFPDELKRVIAASVNGVRIISIYAPNGQALGSDKYAYKLRWYAALASWLSSAIKTNPRLAVLGDFNVAPEDRDVHDPKRWEGEIHVSEPERAAFHKLLQLGFADAFRLFPQPEKEFSWWDYRLNAFQRGWGLRIDEILLSPELAARCAACSIDRGPRGRERPSDHTPVIADLNL